MEKLLSAKHWQIFILLLVGLIIGSLKIENDATLTSILTIVGIIIYAIYPLALGHFLQEYLPKKVELNHNLFLINVFLWITVYSIVTIISDGEGMTFDGLLALPIFYVFFAIIHSFTFPARTLKTVEIGRKAGFGEYVGEFFLILFLPLGIWFLQPRINKIINENHPISDNPKTENLN